jgi:hypothetical protein
VDAYVDAGVDVDVDVEDVEVSAVADSVVEGSMIVGAGGFLAHSMLMV